MPNDKQYDFSGYATVNDVKCSDGLIIRAGAFAHNDGKIVPLVYNHDHNDPFNVLGYALLENKEKGVYAYGFLNNTETGKAVREEIRHGDITNMSIYARSVKRAGNDVMHGDIKEVSLVLSGANPGAVIDSFIEHSDLSDDGFSAYVYTPDEYSIEPYANDIQHSSEKDEEALVTTDTEETSEIEHSSEEDKKEEKETSEEDKKEAKETSDKDNEDSDAKEIWDSMSQEQKDLTKFLVASALTDKGEKEKKDEKEVKQSDLDEKGEDNMSHNVFDTNQEATDTVLTHSDEVQIFKDAKRSGSFKTSLADYIQANETLAHSVGQDTDDNGDQYISYLFPDYQTLNNEPKFIDRDQAWVSVVMDGVHKTPFSRIKSVFADITEDDARALGYVKGDRKIEEVFSLLKRTTDPQTVYKLQSMDRDDLNDITSFDVVAWLWKEMRGKLNEEIARAILIGDGRLSSSNNKISEDHIRSIWNEDELFTVNKVVAVGDDEYETAKNVIRAAIRARKDYRGAGTPTLFATEDFVTDALLMEDGIGHPLYQSETQLATAMRVKNIVTVPVMENQTRTVTVDGVEQVRELVGIIVNLNDYNVGTDKGGQITTFDDFDIEYNKYRYLIEGRCSGALITPFSAIIIEKDITDSSNEENPEETSQG